MKLIAAIEIIDFWFKELEPKQWWIKDTAFDQMLVQRFGELHASAAAGELSAWRESGVGRLAEIIVLDQFSRNMFRDTTRAFSQDAMALVLAQEAIRAGADQSLNPSQKSFLYMPFMHSESLLIHEQAVELYSQDGMQGNLDFEIKHKKIIERFGRYPHRNKILGRESTAEELEFLSMPGSGF